MSFIVEYTDQHSILGNAMFVSFGALDSGCIARVINVMSMPSGNGSCHSSLRIPISLVL